MQITIKLKLSPTKEQEQLISAAMKEYIFTVNECAADMVTFNEYGKLSSSNVKAKLPSALKAQCIQDARSIFKQYRKTGIEPILKKPVAVWNNQNYKVAEKHISFPVLINNKSHRILVKANIPAERYDLLCSHKLGILRITKKNSCFIAQIAVEVPESVPAGNGTMGIDLGLKCPAVCITDAGKVKFIGNGRKNKYVRRHFKTKRRKLGKAKKATAIKKLNNKEQRIMKDIDHKLSREIVNFAAKNGIGIIKMEQLADIRSTTRKSRKNEHNLHNWSFYRLASFIEYKAKLSGIQVAYINPAYTSQRCPVCGELNHAKDRDYQCKCGYHTHRDLVGAVNICAA